MITFADLEGNIISVYIKYRTKTKILDQLDSDPMMAPHEKS